MLLLTLRGTPTLYYGDELGMANFEIPPDKVVDPPGVTLGRGRDGERTPMQWDGSRNAGFTSAEEPWLPLAHDYAEQNAAGQREDPRSTLTLHHRLIQLRQSEDALMAGSYARMHSAGDILAYTRRQNGNGFAILLNLGGEGQVVELDAANSGRIALSTHLDREGDEVSGRVSLRPNEGVVVRLG